MHLSNLHKLPGVFLLVVLLLAIPEKELIDPLSTSGPFQKHHTENRQSGAYYPYGFWVNYIEIIDYSKDLFSYHELLMFVQIVQSYFSNAFIIHNSKKKKSTLVLLIFENHSLKPYSVWEISLQSHACYKQFLFGNNIHYNLFILL